MFETGLSSKPHPTRGENIRKARRETVVHIHSEMLSSYLRVSTAVKRHHDYATLINENISLRWWLTVSEG